MEQSKQVLEQMYENYQDDPYMISKIHHYIQKQLPTLLENIRNTRQQNMERMVELSLEQEQFINAFLNRNHYYYVSTTEKFVYYDGIHYTETLEDHILYHILNTISQERNPKIITWKHKTKVSILKRIKENKLKKTIPESETIQSVLNLLLTNGFTSKSEAKYFLTVLGDNILKKNTTHIHFLTNVECKTFLKEVNQTVLYFFGNQCTQTFKTKFHEKHYEDDRRECRILPISKIDHTDSVYMLDLVCVACHYSIRYGDADSFVLRDTDLEQKVMRLTTVTQEVLVQQFLKEYIVETEDKKNLMTWQNMFYLWKMFLRSEFYPPSFFQNNIKTYMTQTMFQKNYKEDGDFFVGISSSQLPNIQFFLNFWKENMVPDVFETDLEIEEIAGLFRFWGESLKWKNGYLNEQPILDIILYYFPDIEIEHRKYIHRYRCVLWDKPMDIHIALQEYANTLISEKHTTPAILSIYDAYLFYCKFYSNPNSKKIPFLVSKTYFDKYMLDNYQAYILEDGIIQREWTEEI